MSITFHKASDQTPSLKNTLMKLSDMKVDTMLTQGGTKGIIENI